MRRTPTMPGLPDDPFGVRRRILHPSAPANGSPRAGTGINTFMAQYFPSLYLPGVTVILDDESVEQNEGGEPALPQQGKGRKPAVNEEKQPSTGKEIPALKSEKEKKQDKKD